MTPSPRPWERVRVQLASALILAQWLSVLQRQLGWPAELDPFDVSMPLVVQVLKRMPAGPAPLLEQLVEHAGALGLLRPCSRLKVQLPTIQPPLSQAPADREALVRRARSAQRNPHPAPLLSFLASPLIFSFSCTQWGQIVWETVGDERMGGGLVLVRLATPSIYLREAK